jgi:hypothetical protein
VASAFPCLADHPLDTHVDRWRYLRCSVLKDPWVASLELAPPAGEDPPAQPRPITKVTGALCTQGGECRYAGADLENYIAASKIVLTGQDSKGQRWMPWRQEPKKDVDGCDKPR